MDNKKKVSDPILFPNEVLERIILGGSLQDRLNCLLVSRDCHAMTRDLPLHAVINPGQLHAPRQFRAVCRRFRNVIQLDLTGCNFLRSLDLTELVHLSKLSSLKLNFCAEIVTIRPVSRLTSLRNLSLAHCTSLSPMETRVLTSLVDLRILYMDRCPILDQSMVPLRTLTTLESLSLSGCRITTTGLNHVTALVNLRRLNLRGCVKLLDSPLGLSALTSLVWLNVRATQLPPLTLTSLQNLTVLQNLSP